MNRNIIVVSIAFYLIATLFVVAHREMSSLTDGTVGLVG